MLESPLIFFRKEEIPAGSIVADAFEGALTELFFIDRPQFKKGMPEAESALRDFVAKHNIPEVWIYFPWKNITIRSLPEDLYFKLRTTRNRNLITEKEQKKYRNLKIGIAGLSVGSAVLSSAVMTGGPKLIKIADPDTVEVSNLNRIKSSLLEVGLNKSEVTARRVWELDPFAKIYVCESGISKDNLEEFILGDPRLDVFIDEMDSIELKIRARLICKENRIPVLMATDNGDGIILDVERFDKEAKRPIFHGLIDEWKIEGLSNLDYQKWLELATKIVGPQYLTPKMQESLLEIGKSIASVPQLGTSAELGGGAITFALRRIANGEDLVSGRYTINFEEKLVPDYNSNKNIKWREAKAKKFLEKFGEK